MSTNPIDEAFLPLGDFIEASADIEGSVADPSMGIGMAVEWTEINMPVELDIAVDDAGAVSLGAIPPLYYVETTVVPVFHQVTLTLEVVRDTTHGK